MVGGIFGALVLALLIPVVRPFALAFGPAEFVILVLGALLGMSVISSGPPRKVLIAALLGVLISFIGQEGSTASLR